MLRTGSAAAFACLSKACAPPPVGQGGSLKSGGSSPEGLSQGSSSAGGRRTLDGEHIVSWFNLFSHDGVTCKVFDAKGAYGVEVDKFLSVKMDFYDKDGNDVGSASHDFDFIGSVPLVFHMSFRLAASKQGLGIGSKFIEHSLNLYRQIGVKKVLLSATSNLTSGMNGALVWAKVGFDFNGQPQKDLAMSMKRYEEVAPYTFRWSDGLIDRVRRGTASIKDVMAEDRGDIFLRGDWGTDQTVTWNGSINLDDVTVVAAASHRVEVSLAAWGDAEETCLRPVRSRYSARISTTVFACLSKACAPPPAGKGGSLPQAHGSAPSKEEALAFIKATPSIFEKVVFDEAQSYKPDLDIDVSGKMLANSRVMKHLLEDEGYQRWKARTGAADGQAAATVKSVIDQWASNSSPTEAYSLAQHRAAASVHGTSYEDARRAASPDQISRADAWYEDDGDLFEAIVRAEYKATQEWFAQQGIKEVTLHRGMALDTDAQFGETVTAQMYPLSSWSEYHKEAKFFSKTYGDKTKRSIVLSTRVPVEMIQSIPLTGRGCLMEYEFVLIGQPTEALVSYASEGFG